MSQHDHELERRARDLYLRASRDVDPAMAGRLRAARRTALERPSPHSTVRRVLIPASAFAVVALATLMVWQPLGGPSSAPPAVVQAVDATDPSDLPPDADSTDPTLYKDLQFYSWLAYNDSNGQGRSTK
ncbi:MAG TPA: hypothetical protein VGN46_03655 [Luteibacter sp.]|uniref:hypothetical protein n=1 Tax=Luteibacter sp. TaxID=1886636 RepID=UPI002F3E9FD2